MKREFGMGLGAHQKEIKFNNRLQASTSVDRVTIRCVVLAAMMTMITATMASVLASDYSKYDINRRSLES